MPPTRFLREFNDKQVTSADYRKSGRKISCRFLVHSLTLIEGGNETIKSIFTRHIMDGGMRQNYSFEINTTKNSTGSSAIPIESMGSGIFCVFLRNIYVVVPILSRWHSMDQRRDTEYPPTFVCDHHFQHGAGGDHLNLLDQGDSIWPVLM